MSDVFTNALVALGLKSEEEKKDESKPLAIQQLLSSSPSRAPAAFMPTVRAEVDRDIVQSQEDLADSKELRNDIQLGARLHNAGTTIGNAFNVLGKPVDNTQNFERLMITGDNVINQAQAQARIEQDALLRKQQAEERIDTMRMRIAELRQRKQDALDLRQQQMSNKARELQDNHFERIYHTAMNPKARDVSQAGINLIKGQNAMKLLEDPEMTKEKWELLASELVALAQGGAPHADAVRALNINNFQSIVSDARRYATGNPIDDLFAQNANKIKETLRPYISHVMKNNLNILDNEFDKNLTYLERNPHRFGRDNIETFRQSRDQFTKRVQLDPNELEQIDHMDSLTPQDKQASDWAKATLNDPNADSVTKKKAAEITHVLKTKYKSYE
jgi:hypothetical protein